MKIDLNKLEKDQILILLRKLNIKMASCNQRTYGYVQLNKKYQVLMREFKRRRDIAGNEGPEVIRRDINNQFGIINQKYYQTLSAIDREIYINWKWVEL